MSSTSSSENDNKPTAEIPQRDTKPRLSISPASASVHRCRFCPMTFSTPTALGGHQNAHRRERDAQKKRAESSKTNFPASPASSMSSMSRLWAPLSAPQSPPQSLPLVLFPPGPMTPSGAVPASPPRALDLFPSTPVARSLSAPPVFTAPPPPAFMAPPPPVALPPASRRPVLHNFFGPGAAGAAEEEEEDLNLDLTL